MEDQNMKAEQARKLTDKALEELATALDQGKSETLMAYLATVARFHRYSFGNIMLIMAHNPDATRVAGFRTWKKLGRYVIKGQKGIVIIAPMLLHKNEKAASRQSDDEKVLRFRAAYVFDVSQTDGDPLPEPAAVGGNPNSHTDRLREFVQTNSIKLEYASDAETQVALGNTEGASFGGRILLRENLSPAEEFATLTHELAHELLHGKEDRKKLSKSVRETEAEAVAFVVCQSIGLDVGTSASDYIQLYAGDKQTLAGSLDRIQKTATAIIEAVSEDD
jgi:antirestriction protein ArdC